MNFANVWPSFGQHFSLNLCVRLQKYTILYEVIENWYVRRCTFLYWFYVQKVFSWMNQNWTNQNGIYHFPVAYMGPLATLGCPLEGLTPLTPVSTHRVGFKLTQKANYFLYLVCEFSKSWCKGSITFFFMILPCKFAFDNAKFEGNP